LLKLVNNQSPRRIRHPTIRILMKLKFCHHLAHLLQTCMNFYCWTQENYIFKEFWFLYSWRYGSHWLFSYYGSPRYQHSSKYLVSNRRKKFIQV